MAVLVAHRGALDQVLGFGPGGQVAFGELVQFPVDGHVYSVHLFVAFPYMVLYQVAASAAALGVPATSKRKIRCGIEMRSSVSRMKMLPSMRWMPSMTGASMAASSGGVRVNCTGSSRL